MYILEKCYNELKVDFPCLIISISYVLIFAFMDREVLFFFNNCFPTICTFFKILSLCNYFSDIWDTYYRHCKQFHPSCLHNRLYPSKQPRYFGNDHSHTASDKSPLRAIWANKHTMPNVQTKDIYAKVKYLDANRYGSHASWDLIQTWNKICLSIIELFGAKLHIW